MGRKLTFEIFRYNPNTPDIAPTMQPYELEEVPGMTLFTALMQIRENQDPSLMFDFVCRAGICGSCGMIVNGIQKMACRTLTRDLSPHIRLLPLPIFKLIGDLSVDTGTWFRDLNLKTRSWIHNDEPFDPKQPEAPMHQADAAKIYEAERCIECGLCIAACGTIKTRSSFLGAAGLNKIARFMLDPRDGRSPEDYFDLIGTDQGIFCCFETMMCEDSCPLGLPLDVQMDYVRRKLAETGHPCDEELF